MRLSEHFTLAELTRSDMAARLDLDNAPTSEITENLEWLCVEVLEPLRNALGRPIFISSGYRSPAVNAAVGGSKSSDHLLGLAADITAPPIAIQDIATAIRRLAPYIPLKQCIVEFGEWVHVSCWPRIDVIRSREPQFLLARREGGRTVYEQWIA